MTTKRTKRVSPGEKWLPRNQRARDLSGCCEFAIVDRVNTRGVEFTVHPLLMVYQRPVAAFTAMFAPSEER